MAKKVITRKSRSNVEKYLFTSESVTMGHPDKVSDHISDSILDAMLAQDPKSRVAWLVCLCDNLSARMYDADTLDIVRKNIEKTE